MNPFARVGKTFERAKAAVGTRIDAARRRSPFVDHLVETLSAYKVAGGDREAAALSYYAFFAVFPLVLIAVAILGFVIRDADEVRTTVLEGLGRVLPGSGEFFRTSLDAISRRAAVIGLIGLLGVVYSGLGAIDVLRGALDRVFRVEERGGIGGKLRNVRFAAMAGFLLIISLALSMGAAWGVNAALVEVGVDEGLVRVGASIVTLVLTFVADVALFVVLLAFLPDHNYGWRDVLSGAVFAALGFLVLKQVGGVLVAANAARSSAAYGIGAAVFGLLLVINFSARLTMLAANWTAIQLNRSEREGRADRDDPDEERRKAKRGQARAVAL